MKIKDAIRVLMTPSCWIQNHRFNAGWDRKLSQLLDDGHGFENIGQYEATIGGVGVWISNHPYASFTTHGGRFPRFRPRRATILRAMDRLEDSMFWDDEPGGTS